VVLLDYFANVYRHRRSLRRPRKKPGIGTSPRSRVSRRMALIVMRPRRSRLRK
jgi:hypothetical protein